MKREQLQSHGPYDNNLPTFSTPSHNGGERGPQTSHKPPRREGYDPGGCENLVIYLATHT